MVRRQSRFKVTGSEVLSRSSRSWPRFANPTPRTSNQHLLRTPNHGPWTLNLQLTVQRPWSRVHGSPTEQVQGHGFGGSQSQLAVVASVCEPDTSNLEPALTANPQPWTMDPEPSAHGSTSMVAGAWFA